MSTPPGLTYILNGTFPKRILPGALLTFLRDFAVALEMTWIRTPVVTRTEDIVGGIVNIAEGHVAIHQWRNGEAWLGLVIIATSSPDLLKQDVVRDHLYKSLGFDAVSEQEIVWDGSEAGRPSAAILGASGDA
jgi:hypothetical protein